MVDKKCSIALVALNPIDLYVQKNLSLQFGNFFTTEVIQNTFPDSPKFQ